MLIFGIVIFMRMSFARTNRRQVFRIVKRWPNVIIAGDGTRRLVIARPAAAAATAATSGAWGIFARFGVRGYLADRFRIKRFAFLSRARSRSRTRGTIGAATRTSPPATAAAARTITRGFAFAFGRSSPFGFERFFAQRIITQRIIKVRFFVERFGMPFNDWRAADLFVDDPKHVKAARARGGNFVVPQFSGCLAGVEQRLAGAVYRANGCTQIIQIVVFVIAIAP